ncbi:MAG: tRNA (guanosine(46)-N7)-methyltransferase TrmB [Campylobacterota bacterium]|nr:tRNA (guanosine(46)-N7)-methyltransferase TrmB [Campylobacterota bacterium]
MPHSTFNAHTPLNIPCIVDEVSFNFIARSRGEDRICVSNKGKEFLLTQKTKGDKTLIKTDKVTRVTPINIVKEAINAYTKATNANITSSNTNILDQKLKPKDEYLKEINYFVEQFDTDKEIYIEIGFGSGRHLLHQAKKHPNIQFIGLEIHTPSIEQMLKHVRLDGISNVLAVDYDARLFMEFIRSNRVGKIFVHFPVPWDKKPHRRIYSQDFIDEALRVLKVGGSLELRTDSRKYFDYCTELLTTQPTGEITIDINKDLAVSSKYEDRWKFQGKNIYDLKLFNHFEHDQRNFNYDFSFDQRVDIENFSACFDTKAIVQNNFVVSFSDLYVSDDKKTALLQLTMGNINRTLSKYILIKDGKASYFQGDPLPTSSNIQAHEVIKKRVQCD